MNLKKIFLAVCVACLCCVYSSHAQRVPIGAIPTFYNGGFAGEAGDLRIASYSHVGGSYFVNETWIHGGTEISADKFLRKLRSGVAFTSGYSGSRYGANFSASSTIAPKFSFKGKYTFSPFLQVNLSSANYHYDLDANSTQGLPQEFSVRSISANTGFLLNSAKAYFGATVRPFSYERTTIPQFGSHTRFFSGVSYTLMGGYTFQRTPESDFSFTPQVAFSVARFKVPDLQAQEQTTHTSISIADINLVMRYKKLIGGINNNGIMVGYQVSRFKLQFTNFYRTNPGYGKSIDFSGRTHFNATPILIGSQGYFGSLSLRYIFSKKQSPKMPGFF
jgi:hypothetical protein